MIAGFIYLYKKLPLAYFLFLLAVLIGAPVLMFKNYEKRFMLSFVPDALQVTSVVYTTEESWGFGPGGNETGIRVYRLPEQVANEISLQGIEFLNNLPPNHNQQERRWRGRYQTWLPTPISESDKWKLRAQAQALNIYDYLCAYGFCIKVDDAVVKQTTDIIWAIRQLLMLMLYRLFCS